MGHSHKQIEESEDSEAREYNHKQRYTMIDIEKIDSIRRTIAEYKLTMFRVRKSFRMNESPSEEKISQVYGILSAIEICESAKMLVIVYLFTPEVLLGMRMRKGVRRFIALLFGFKNDISVSRKLRNLMFYYRNYVDFRSEVDQGITIARRNKISEK